MGEFCGPCAAGPSQNLSAAPPSRRIPSDIEAVQANLRAKEYLLRNVTAGQQVVAYELATRVYFAKWGATSMTLLAALWAPGLPVLELLAFHRDAHPAVRLAQCVSQRPLAVPNLRLPNGESVTCRPWWATQRDMVRPMKVVSGRGGQPIITTVRYHCPVSPCHALCLSSRSNLSLHLSIPALPPETENRSIAFRLLRRSRPYTVVKACTQPLWGYERMRGMYPNLLHEWLAFLKIKGFAAVHVYELWRSDFAADLKQWVASGFVEYHPGWAPGKWAKDSFRWVYCTQSTAHDHCVFTNQLHATWLMMVHGPDLYPCANCTSVVTELAKYDPFHNNTLRIQRQECGGRRAPGNRSLMLSFPSCAAPDTVHATPFFQPLRVLATYVHGPLVSLPVVNFINEVIVPPSAIVSVHYYDAFKGDNSSGKGQLFEDNLRGDRRPLYSHRVDLTDAHRRVTDLLRRFPANNTAAPLP
jgi:hypothetical protein